MYKEHHVTPKANKKNIKITYKRVLISFMKSVGKWKRSALCAFLAYSTCIIGVSRVSACSIKMMNGDGQ